MSRLEAFHKEVSFCEFKKIYDCVYSLYVKVFQSIRQEKLLLD